MPPTALLILTLLSATTPVPPAPPPPVKLEYPLAGYRIDALDSSTKATSIFTMSVPGSGNSHPLSLVEVRSQPTMKERPSYQNIKDAKTLLAHNGDTILLERTPSPSEWMLEYTGEEISVMTLKKTGTKIHTYQRMFLANGIAYDVSATAPDARWPELGLKLKACVDSFELSSAPAPGKFAFPQQGFRISKLDGAIPMDAEQELLSMRGQSDVFVGIEPYTKTLQDYQAEHKPRFSTYPIGNIKVLAETSPAENALVSEYAQEIPADKIHPEGDRVLIYEKVVLAHGQLYWAAGLHFDDDKAVSSAQIKASVESLEAMPAPAPAK